VRDIAAGMLLLEQANVVHGDLSCENLLVSTNGSQYLVKLAYFELSQYNRRKTRRTTKRLSTKSAYPREAPEVVQYQDYTTRSDVFKFGVVMFDVLNQRKATCPGLENQPLYEWLSRGNFPPLPVDIPPEITRLMHVCLATEAEARPTFAEAIAILNECFMVRNIPELSQTSSSKSAQNEPDTYFFDSGSERYYYKYQNSGDLVGNHSRYQAGVAETPAVAREESRYQVGVSEQQLAREESRYQSGVVETPVERDESRYEATVKGNPKSLTASTSDDRYQSKIDTDMNPPSMSKSPSEHIYEDQI